MGKEHRFYKNNNKRPYLTAAAVVAGAAVILGGTFLLVRALDPYHNRILPQVTVGGFDIGGMTKSEARKALTASLSDTLLEQDLVIVLPEATLSFSADAIGMSVDIREAVKDAYALGRTGPKEQRQSEANSAHCLGLLPYLEYDQTIIRGALESYAHDYATVLSEPTYHLEGDAPALSTDSAQEDVVCQSLVLTKGMAQSMLDTQALYDQVLAEYDQAIALCDEGSFGIEVSEIEPSEVPLDLDLEEIYTQICSDPVSDSLDMENYTFVNGQYGYVFSIDEAEQALSQAEYGESVTIPMQTVRPEQLGQEVYYQDVLGSCSTHHNDNEDRNTNLRLICEILDGHILQPGEEFSFNGVVGERTAERGFKPAPAFSGNRLTNSIGGGACQTSTTLYNCVLLADLEVVTRLCHGAVVSYVPLGLDAAVNWGTTDFAFRNNFHFPIMIRAKTTEDNVEMEILGTDEKDYYIVMTAGSSEHENCYQAVSYKNKYDKVTGELISKEREAFSTYYKGIG